MAKGLALLACMNTVYAPDSLVLHKVETARILLRAVNMPSNEVQAVLNSIDTFVLARTDPAMVAVTKEQAALNLLDCLRNVAKFENRAT